MPLCTDELTVHWGSPSGKLLTCRSAGVLMAKCKRFFLGSKIVFLKNSLKYTVSKPERSRGWESSRLLMNEVTYGLMMQFVNCLRVNCGDETP
jgi:hypothetical protein